jgi:hypothetical protein
MLGREGKLEASAERPGAESVRSEARASALPPRKLPHSIDSAQKFPSAGCEHADCTGLSTTPDVRRTVIKEKARQDYFKLGYIALSECRYPFLAFDRAREDRRSASRISQARGRHAVKAGADHRRDGLELRARYFPRDGYNHSVHAGGLGRRCRRLPCDDRQRAFPDEGRRSARRFALPPEARRCSPYAPINWHSAERNLSPASFPLAGDCALIRVGMQPLGEA